MCFFRWESLKKQVPDRMARRFGGRQGCQFQNAPDMFSKNESGKSDALNRVAFPGSSWNKLKYATIRKFPSVLALLPEMCQGHACPRKATPRSAGQGNIRLSLQWMRNIARPEGSYRRGTHAYASPSAPPTRSQIFNLTMRIVFCGTGDIGAPTLRALLDSNRHEVAGVITQPDKPAGRDLKPRASAIKLLAIERGIPVYQPAKIRSPESIEALESMRPEVMVVVAYGQILPARVLQIPRLGCLNLHASLLPRHRGAAPIHSAILSGDQETGMTVMYMDEGLDTGDILLMERTPIGLTDTAGELHDRLAEIGAPALLKALDLLASGTAPRIPQNPHLATHVGKLKKTDGFLHWQEPAARLALRVRAMSPWPCAFARLGGQTLKIHEASVSSLSGTPGQILAAGAEGITIAAGTDSLTLKTIQLEGRKRLAAGDFLRGHPLKAGDSMDLSFPEAR